MMTTATEEMTKKEQLKTVFKVLIIGMLNEMSSLTNKSEATIINETVNSLLTEVSIRTNLK